MSRGKEIILYHASCHDGFAAATTAHLYHLTEGIDGIYIGLDPNRLIEGVRGLTKLNSNIPVRSFDIAFIPDAYKILRKHFKDIKIFDHHKSFVSNFDNKLPKEVIYDNSLCGAILAWNYYFPTKDIPIFLKYIQARDTWKWDLFGKDKIEETKQICLGLYAACTIQYLDNDETKPDFYLWIAYFENKNWFSTTLKYGQVLEEHQKNVLSKLKKSATLVKFNKHIVAICNSPVEHSDLGNQLASELKCDCALIWRVTGTTVYISLRSIGDFDVSELARKYGGGGHLNAAAFSCTFNKFKLLQHELIVYR